MQLQLKATWVEDIPNLADPSDLVPLAGTDGFGVVITEPVTGTVVDIDTTNWNKMVQIVTGMMIDQRCCNYCALVFLADIMQFGTGTLVYDPT